MHSTICAFIFLYYVNILLTVNCTETHKKLNSSHLVTDDDIFIDNLTELNTSDYVLHSNNKLFNAEVLNESHEKVENTTENIRKLYIKPSYTPQANSDMNNNKSDIYSREEEKFTQILIDLFQKNLKSQNSSRTIFNNSHPPNTKIIFEKNLESDDSTNAVNKSINTSIQHKFLNHSNSESALGPNYSEISYSGVNATQTPKQLESEVSEKFIRHEDSFTDSIKFSTLKPNFENVSNQEVLQPLEISTEITFDRNNLPETIFRRARLLDDMENAASQENKMALRPGPVSRLPVLPRLPMSEDPSTTEPPKSTNITNEPLKKFLTEMRVGRVAEVRFSENSNREVCITSDGEEGSCVLLTTCKEVMDNLAQSNPTICHWDNDMPFVCCPSSTSSRKLEVPGCGTRVIKGLNKVSRTIPQFASPAFDNKAPVIAGGKESTIGAWPWMAGIYHRNRGSERFLCGATIINDKYLVSAAHCFVTYGSRNVQAARYAIRVGSSNTHEGTLHLIESVIIHPQYSPREHYNDITVIKLKDHLNFKPNVRPICLPVKQDIRKKKLQGRDVTVTGWGDTEFGGKSSIVLREVTVQVIDIPTCDEAYKEVRGMTLPRGITKDFICAGTLEGGKDACSRDSGGPLMFMEKGVYYLVGVVSFGFQCARVGYPGVYTRVTNYLNWLEEVAFTS